MSGDYALSRVEIPLADVQVTDEERRDLLRRHSRRDSVAREVWDETLNALVLRDVPLPAPVCWTCGELWGDYGCSTSRAVQLLALWEREAQQGRRRVSELTEALTPRFGVSRLKERGNNTVELRMYIDEYTLLYGAMGVVEATLAKMRDHWRQWFKDVGDQRRARADKVWALSIDSERYVWLTQSFNPSAAAIKRPEAPWDDPEWTNGLAAERSGSGS